MALVMNNWQGKHSLTLSLLYLKLTVLIKFQIYCMVYSAEKRVFLFHKELILHACAIFEEILALRDITTDMKNGRDILER